MEVKGTDAGMLMSIINLDKFLPRKPLRHYVFVFPNSFVLVSVYMYGCHKEERQINVS